MTMTPRLRKLTLTAHVTVTVGWLGAVLVFLALAVVGLTSQDAQTVRGAYLVMQPYGRRKQQRPDGGSTTSTPRWVKVFGIIGLVVVLVFISLMFTRGHGPGRHRRSHEERPIGVDRDQRSLAYQAMTSRSTPSSGAFIR